MLCLVLILITTLVFIRIVGFNFVQWADDMFVYGNPHLQGPLSVQLHWMLTDVTFNRLYMPFGWLQYSLTFLVFGLDPQAHHFVNLVIHLINTLLVFAILRQLLRITNNSNGGRSIDLAAFTGALIWAVHPLRVEVVAWVAARLHSYAAMFALLAFWFYLRAISQSPGLAWKRFAYWAAVVFFGVSLLSFPIALLFPVVLFILDIYVLRPARTRSGSPGGVAFFLEKIPFCIVAAIPTIAGLWGQAHAPQYGSPPTLAQFGIFARFAQACYVWIDYVIVTVAPIHLSPTYSQLWSFSPTDSIFIASILAVIAISVVTFRSRRSHPALWAAWLCHLVYTIPFLGLTESPHFASDRYTYLDAVIWSALIAGILCRRLQAPVGQRIRQLLATAGVALVVGTLGLLSYQQLRIWHDSEGLFLYVIAELRDHPYRAEIDHHLGIFYYREGRFAEAAQALDRSSAILPTPENLSTAGDCYVRSHNLPAAAARVQLACRMAPNNPAINLQLAKIYEAQGKLPLAEMAYRRTLELEPNSHDALLHAGILAGARGAIPEATAAFQKLVHVYPDDSIAWKCLGNALAMQGNPILAQQAIEQSLRLNPNQKDAQATLDLIRRATTRPEAQR